MDAFSVTTLWNDHGIVADILVGQFLLYGIILVLIIALAAIYSILSTCGYSRTHGTRPTSSNY